MKKAFIFILLYACLAIQQPGYSSVQLCVPLAPSSTCKTQAGDAIQGKVSWSTTCNDIKIKGIGVCSSTPSGSIGNTADTISTSRVPSENQYCWCKMVSPAVSQFVFAASNSSFNIDCTVCAAYCASWTMGQSKFRTAILSNLSE